MIDVCRLQVRRRVHGARMLGIKGRNIRCGGLGKKMELVVLQ